MATWLGDTTPIKQGRLTLSPTAHADPIGTIAVPGVAFLMGYLTGRPIRYLAWAKPVEFVPTNFTRKVSMWQGAALCAVAGPGANVILAVLAALVLRALISFVPEHVYLATRDGAPHTPLGFAVRFAAVMMQLNVTLAFFNLFPMPPLDGGYLIPRRFGDVRDFLSRYSFWLLMLLFFVPIGAGGSTLGWMVLGPPVELTLGLLLRVAGVA